MLITKSWYTKIKETGKLKKKARVKTNVKGLIEFVWIVPKPKKIFIEEGILASWLLEIGLRYGKELIIADPKINIWMGTSYEY